MKARAFVFSLAVGAAGFLASCGMSPSSSELSVSNGKEIPLSDYPEVIMLYDKEKGALCTGTFIDEVTVLTAAHCSMNGPVIDSQTGKVDRTLQLITMENVDGEKKATILAESTEIYRHPKWDDEFKKQQVNSYDLGIVRFEKGVASAVAEMGSSPVKRGDDLTVIGFGLNYVPRNQNDIDPSSVGVKRLGTNSVMMLQGGFIYFQGATKTTDASGNNANAAPGDSGGPMFIDGKLVGVTSGGGRTIFGGGVSVYVDLQSNSSREFLGSLGY